MNIFKKIKSFLLDYTFLEPLAQGESFSTNIKIQRNLDKSIWAGKFSRPLPHADKNIVVNGKPYVRVVDFCDMDDRAILGFRLAKLAGLKSLKSKIVPIKRIENFDINSIGHRIINNKIFLTEFRGKSLDKYLESNSFSSFEVSDISNKDEVIRSFVFNLWVGNYDNKDKDYLVDNNKNLISIDYQLSGPGFKNDPKLALGAWGEAFDIDSSEDTGWCIGNGGLLDYLKNRVNDLTIFEKTITKINSISKTQIKLAMTGLRFYKQGTTEKINDAYYDFLLERRKKLEEVIKKWITDGCPIARLPKDNGTV